MARAATTATLISLFTLKSDPMGSQKVRGFAGSPPGTGDQRRLFGSSHSEPARSSANRQPSHPNSRLLENHNGTGVEIGLQGGKVSEQKLELPFWPPLGSVSEEDDRRLRLVLPGPSAKERCRSGISRHGLERQLALADGLGRVPQSLADIGALQIWVSGEDLVVGHAVCDHGYDRRHRYAQPPDTRLATHLISPESDSLVPHCVSSVPRLAVDRTGRARPPEQAR
jgi:hypothetical protein